MWLAAHVGKIQEIPGQARDDVLLSHKMPMVVIASIEAKKLRHPGLDPGSHHLQRINQ